MRKIKESINAITAGDAPGAVRISKEEHEPMSDGQMRLALMCVTRVSVIAAVTVMVLFADMQNLLALFVPAGVVSVFYFIAKL